MLYHQQRAWTDLSYGLQIIWLSWGLTDADLSGMPAATIHSFVGRFVEPPVCDGPAQDGFGFDLGDGKGRCLMNGSWNTQLYGPLAEECRPDADIICSKNRVSGLWNDTTPFSRALEKHKIKTLLFAGVNTDQCILGTLLDAYYRGMDCLMLQDCCATTTPGGQELPERGASVCWISRSFNQRLTNDSETMVLLSTADLYAMVVLSFDILLKDDFLSIITGEVTGSW